MIVESDRLISPFPGLRSFEPDEVDLFFGREDQVDELLSRLQKSRFLGILGPSGSGKSSLVRAGLLPSLYGGFMADAGSGWRIAIFRPGGDPVVNLARALGQPDALGAQKQDDFADVQHIIIETTLRSSAVRGLVDVVKQARLPEDENLLIVVDQFEELFRYKHNMEAERAQEEATLFTQLLINASHQQEIPIYIAITMRSDFLGDCTEFPNLAETINEGMYLIPRMNREQRRLAITGPVAVGEAEIAPRLVIRLLNDVGDNPDQLPILQHALMRTWDYWCDHRQHGKPLDLHHYEKIGGMAGALDQHAEEAYRELPDEHHRAIAQVLFKRLTHKGSDARGVRRPTAILEICDVAGASVEEVVVVAETFRTEGRTFLMPPAGEALQANDKLDISHESLMRVWKRLIRWVDEEAQSEHTYRELATAAAIYQEGKRGVLVDPELQLYLNWRKQRTPNEAWALRYDPSLARAMTYLDYSAKERDRKLAHEEYLRKQKLKRARRLAAFFGLAAVVIIVLGIWTFSQQGKIGDLRQRQEDIEQEIALAELKVQENNREAADAIDRAEKAEHEADSLGKKAATAQRTADSLGTKAATAQRIADSLGEKAQEEIRRAEIAQGEADSLGTEAKKAIAQRDQAKTQQDSLNTEITRFSRSFAARKLAIESSKRPPGDLTGLLALQAFIFHKETEGSPQDPVIYNALRHALGPQDNDVLAHHEDQVRAVAFSPDGRYLASAADDASIQLKDLQRAKITPLNPPSVPARIRSIAFSSTSKRMAAGTVDGRVLVWNLNPLDEKPLTATARHDAVVHSLIFSNEGKVLYTADLGGGVNVWGVAKDAVEPTALVFQLGPEGARVNAAAASPAPNRSLVAAGVGETLTLRDVNSEGSAPTVYPLGSTILSLAYSADGRTLAVGTKEGTIRLFTLAQDGLSLSGDPVTLRGQNSAVSAVAFHPNGEILASGSLDKTVSMWNINTPQEEPIVLTNHQAWVWSVAFSPDGATLASASADGQVRRWTVHTDSLAHQVYQEITSDDALSPAVWKDLVGDTLPYMKTREAYKALVGQ